MECCESSKLTTSHRPSFGAFGCVGFTRAPKGKSEDGRPSQECVRGTHRRLGGTTHQPRRAQEAEEGAREAATAAQAQRQQHSPTAKHAEVVTEYSAQSESNETIVASASAKLDECSWMRPMLGLRRIHWEGSHYGNKRASTEFHSWESSHAHWSEYAHHRSSWDSSH